MAAKILEQMVHIRKTKTSKDNTAYKFITHYQETEVMAKTSPSHLSQPTVHD